MIIIFLVLWVHISIFCFVSFVVYILLFLLILCLNFIFGLCSAKYHHEAIIVFNDYTAKLPSSQV